MPGKGKGIGFRTSQAPVDAAYLVLTLSAFLTQERLFTPGTALGAVDGGANAVYTLNHIQVAVGDLHTEYALADKTRPAPWVAAVDLAARSLADLGTRAHANLSDAPPDAHHPQLHTLASHTTRTHAELSDAPADAHHPQAHNLASHPVRAHANLSDAPADAHHPQAHGAPEHAAESDAQAIHDNVAGEIAAIAEKAVPVNADLVVIEDSAAANAKRRVQVGNLPGGAAGVNHYQAILPLPGFLPNAATVDRSYHFPVEFNAGVDDVTNVAIITRLAARGRIASANAITFRVSWYDSGGAPQFSDNIVVGAGNNRAEAVLGAPRTVLKGWYATLDIMSNANADAADWVVSAMGTWSS